MMYTLLAVPVVYTLFPCFFGKSYILYGIAFFCYVPSGLGDRLTEMVSTLALLGNLKHLFLQESECRRNSTERGRCMPPMPDRGPHSSGILDVQDQLCTTDSNQKGFSKGHLQRSLSNLPPARQGRLRHCSGNVSAVIQNAFSWGGENVWGGGHFGGGGENVWLKTAFPGTAGTIGRG